MTISHEDATRLLSVLDNRGLQTEVAQIRAQAVLSEIGADTTTARWTYVWNRVLRNATGAQVAVEALASSLADQRRHRPPVD